MHTALGWIVLILILWWGGGALVIVALAGAMMRALSRTFIKIRHLKSVAHTQTVSYRTLRADGKGTLYAVYGSSSIHMVENLQALLRQQDAEIEALKERLGMIPSN